MGTVGKNMNKAVQQDGVMLIIRNFYDFRYKKNEETAKMTDKDTTSYCHYHLAVVAISLIQCDIKFRKVNIFVELMLMWRYYLWLNSIIYKFSQKPPNIARWFPLCYISLI